MSDLFGNHIVGFPTRRLIFLGLYKGRQAGLMYGADRAYVWCK